MPGIMPKFQTPDFEPPYSVAPSEATRLPHFKAMDRSPPDLPRHRIPHHIEIAQNVQSMRAQRNRPTHPAFGVAKPDPVSFKAQIVPPPIDDLPSVHAATRSPRDRL
jgi:hypothetical protein